MNTHMFWCRLIAVIFALCVTLVTLTSCSDTSQQPAGVPMTLQTTFSDPTTPTAADLSTAAVKPDNLADAVATMKVPVISASEGTSVQAADDTPAPQLVVDCGNDGTDNGSLPLTSQNGTMQSSSIAVLPAGDSTMNLSDGSALAMASSTTTVTRAGLAQVLLITRLTVLFSVTLETKPIRVTWTLPSELLMDMERCGSYYRLKDSTLKVKWNGVLSRPPADDIAKLTVYLYKGNTLVAGPLTQNPTVSWNQALFVGHNSTLFNRVEAIADLRDNK